MKGCSGVKKENDGAAVIDTRYYCKAYAGMLSSDSRAVSTK